ncbi:MAG: RNA pyrophosphohydrolase [Mycoplasmataceae bacterium CE_OT135]|nr:MAG: RNA pyrophosphohydrolase [Mycoplasmataceae bacterium CE_OT135]
MAGSPWQKMKLLSFSGGKIEPNETPKEAAKREVFEETNLVIEDLEIVAERLFFWERIRVVWDIWLRLISIRGRKNSKIFNAKINWTLMLAKK